MLQGIDELEKWYEKDDPWKYEHTEDDKKRKNILLSEIPDKDYNNVLDIGCGHGFITKELPGKRITGVDICCGAIKQAKAYENEGIQFIRASLFDLNKLLDKKYDLIIITGVLYPQYIGNSLSLVYKIVDKLLNQIGILISVHINCWYKARFPYLMLTQYFYDYREYTHSLEIYVK